MITVRERFKAAERRGEDGVDDRCYYGEGNNIRCKRTLYYCDVRLDECPVNEMYEG